MRRSQHGFVNWGGNVHGSPAAVEEPRSVLEVIEAIARAKAAGQVIRPVGSGHSFTPLAVTNDRLIRLDRLDRILAVDADAGTVTVEAGIPLWRLNDELATRGLALANLGDIDRQTISGATATGTHGTGARFGGLATFIRGFELATADGQLLRCSAEEEAEVFHCGRVALGALGVITSMTLAVVPAFNLHAIEYPAKFRDVVPDANRQADEHDHYEFYWFPHTETVQVKENDRTAEPVRTRGSLASWRDEVALNNGAFGAVVKVGRLFPGSIPWNAKIVGATIGKVDLVDRSDHVFCSPRLVRFVEMEYAVPRDRLVEAVEGVRTIIDRDGHRVSFPIEVRVAAADDIPLSTGYGRSNAYVAVHAARGTPYRDYFASVEELLAGLDGRPHWGKLHTQTAATLRPRYPEWDRFAAVRRRLDPEGRFTSAYISEVLGPA